HVDSFPVAANQRRAGKDAAMSLHRYEAFIRYLGAFEHLHWLFSQGGPRAFAHAIEVTGRTTPEQCGDALDPGQESQPFFSVRIATESDGRLYFRQVDDAPIPMRVLDGKRGASWEAELGKELSTSVAGHRAPLLRTVLIHQPERSIFMVTAHHAISD